MKHKLLLFGASMLASAGAMAQWTQPVPTASELKVSEGTDTIVYYLYNKDAKMFFTEGNSWGTQASVGNEGLKVFISKYVPTEEEEEGAVWDGKTYLFNDFSIKKNKWMQTFIDSETASFVDHGTQANYFWQIETVDNTTYRLYGGDLNPLYNWENYPATYFGLDISTDAKNTALTPIIYIEEEETPGTYLVNWQFVTEADYAAHREKFIVYEAAQALQATIEEAKTKQVDTAAAEAVYANTNSTLEELQEATATLKKAISEAIENTVTPENPKDMTEEFVVNYTFDENFDGWTSTTGSQNSALADNKVNEDLELTGGLNFSGKFWENWHNSTHKGKMYKVIKEIPNGIYSLQLGAFSDVNPGAYVYANNDSVGVVSSEPRTYKVWTVVDADSIEIGLKKPEACGQWMGIDNAKLVYYGNSLASFQHYIVSIATPAESYEDVYVQQSLLEEYKNTLASAKALATKEEILAAVPTVIAASDAIVANANAYAAYAAAVEEADLYFAEHSDLEGDDVDFVTWYLISEEEPSDDYKNGGAKYILANCLLSTEEILAETEKLKEWKALAIKNGVVEGSDMTSVVTNPNFELPNGEGWTGKITNPYGGATSNHCAEAFNMFFDFYQDVEGLPNGLYKVSVQAFYRATDNANAWEGRETDEVLSEVYFNDFATPVKNVMSIEYEENYANNCWNTPNGTYTLDGMNSASAVFSLEDESMNFTQNVYGLVTDGKMRLGIRQKENAAAKANRWTLWDNFKITFMGKNEEALADVIGSLTETATTLLEADMFETDKAALENAIKVAADAQGGDAMYTALIELNAGIVTAKASVQAYIALNDAASELAEAMSLYENTTSTETLDKADALANEISEGMDNYTAVDAEAKVAEVKEVIAMLRIPDGSTASDEAPVDFTQAIVNPAFDEGNADGWDFSSFTQGNRGYQNNEVYTNPESEAVCDQFMEAWRNAILEDAKAIQEIAYLPAGGYALEVDAFAKNFEDGEREEATGVYLFAQEGEEATLEAIKTVSNVPSHFTLYFTKKEADSKLTIGILTKETNANWFAADNFKLTYYGTESQVSIEDVITSGAEVVAVEYYTLGGVRVATPQKGVNIVKATLADGTVKVSKVIF